MTVAPHAIGKTLRAAIELAVDRGHITTRDIRTLAPHFKRKPHMTARDWKSRGYFLASGTKGRYVPTQYAIRMADYMRALDVTDRAPSCAEWLLVRGYLVEHGAIDVAATRNLLGIRRQLAGSKLYRWRRAGCLRRTHRDTYRLPLPRREAAE